MKTSKAKLPRNRITLKDMPSVAEELIAANLEGIRAGSEREDILRWIFDENSTENMGFERLCEAVASVTGQFDPDTIRIAMKRMFPQEVAMILGENTHGGVH